METRSKFAWMAHGRGTTLYWEVDAAKVCGVAIGALEGPKFEEPTHSWWERSKHGWVRMPENIQHHV
jgi:hypothetical protein